MATTKTQVDRLVTRLGGWPAHFKKIERKHGESLLALLLRERLIDEAVFGQVVRYAGHRAAYDKLSAEIAKEEFQATASNYLSGKEQSRAFHENKLLTLERELLATPYARAKNGQKAQTSFLDLLDEEQKADSSGSIGGAGGGNVSPFKPMARKRG